jgi:RHS repeat-associated protein
MLRIRIGVSGARSCFRVQELMARRAPSLSSDNGAGRLTNQLVSGQARHYAYNFRGQMTALHDMDGRVFSYAFDGDGNRTIQALNDCLTTRFVYDGPNVVLDLNASNEFVHAYVSGPGIDQPVERIGFISGQTRLRHVYHADALGSVVLITDEPGNAVKSYAYEAFGKIRVEGGELLQNRTTYTGREELADSAELRYYRFRVYDPSTGRFLSEDPLRFLTGPNVYLYVDNNPIYFIDSLGLAACNSGYGPTIPGADGGDIPEGLPEGDWSWSPDANNPRGGKWIDRSTTPHREASWEANAVRPHWDVDVGKRNRQRFDRNGRPITAREAHSRPPTGGGGRRGGGGGGGRGGGCFVAGTLVQTPNGAQVIEAIMTGDLVLSYNEGEGIIEAKKVLAVIRAERSDLALIEWDGGTLTCSRNHRFLASSGQWIAAEDLNADDLQLMKGFSDGGASYVRFSVALFDVNENVAVFTLTVEDNHSFLVGPDGIVAHNLKGDDRWRP